MIAIRNDLRINLDAPFVDEEDTYYPNLNDSALWDKFGITFVSEPEPPTDYSEDTYYKTEIDSYPYIRYTPKSPEQIKSILASKLEQAVQNHLDQTAQSKGYDNIVSASSYAAVANPFQAESQAFLVWRAACWAHCYTALAEVEAGTRAIPTKDQLIAELPTLTLP